MRSITTFLIIAASLFPIASHAATSTFAGATGDGGTDLLTGPLTPQQVGSYESARVLGIRLDTVTSTRTGQLRELYDVEFRGGAMNGRRETLSSDVEANSYQIEPRVGDKVVIFVQPDEQGQAHFYLEGFDRRIPLFWLIALFVLTLVLLAGKQGLKVAFSIILSILIIGFVLIPAFLKGANPVPIAMLLAGALTFLSTGLSTGWNRKSLVTAVGTMGGVLVAYLISVVFSNWSHLSGLSSEEDRMFFNQNPLLNPQGLLFAGIIIAAMGVVEDVAVSIASGVEQVHRANDRLSFKDRFRAGMVVGRDHMSALANTLIFAYVGASLGTLLLYAQYQGSWLKFLNFDVVADEVIRSLAGTIGLVFTVPITALLAAWAVNRRARGTAARTPHDGAHT
ncbi:hypothetical protein A3E39_03220 [Candidatus Uhrbacteria bacterium RIFCSPHIGHO2_12_FULL_60_25]|uniref:YibE/F family protein n=1 Tax=Candidatus Uhrbacteria bacterium RIFCSPHIGHO2_12_FULL_60_25 TaxID=1802399 RepID=A0A1F7UNI2_9BACT|nr:MAG: hypothetical protein A3D73_00720 [Candidatus Uhrbacteria bacterium RIFCSPHIGHO2_02_FULL_60_44]OGL79795.1 MAG: hypothetical protein A3E39_03220 [Candidatus Uhrbacteria bacterium RIFCSPHIGHO2_12_FULL_60_25]